MPGLAETDLRTRVKKRVIKAPSVRRAEMMDCAQRLFLLKGYDRTTINDVIEATGLSKGAFYHHFRAKEDLLEAIAQRFAEQSLSYARSVQANAGFNALERLNTLLAMGREWKVEHLPQLRAMFATLLKPENAVLYHRIVGAVFAAMEPTVAAIISQGVHEGLFDTPDAETAADALLWLSSGRQTIVVKAMAAAKTGDVDEATQLIFRRLKSEEVLVDRILGLAPGSVELSGSIEYLRSLVVAWNR